MAGQFDKETSRQNFEWHRERALREKMSSSGQGVNKIVYNLKAIESKHGEKAAKEVLKEVTSKGRNKSRQYFT